MADIAGLGYHTIVYMAPEQAKPYKTWTWACDIWAIGVMLYILCTLGKIPEGNFALAAKNGHQFPIKEHKFGEMGSTF